MTESSPTLEEIRQSAYNSGFFRLLDLKIEQATEGQSTTSIHVGAHLYHPQQIVHGGVIFTLADTAMAMALMSATPPGSLVSTIEAKINYLRPVRTGELLADAAIIQQGRTIAVLEATVYNVQNNERTPIARVLGTFHIRYPKEA